MIASIIAKTMDLVALSSKERELVAALRERVSDEIAINSDLVRDHLRRSKSVRQNDAEVAPLLKRLKNSAYLRVTSGDLSIKRIFPEKLAKPFSPQDSDGKGTRQYLKWIEEDKTAGDLLRRFHRRLELLRTPSGNGESYVDVRYLGFMLSILRNSIKKG